MYTFLFTSRFCIGIKNFELPKDYILYLHSQNFFKFFNFELDGKWWNSLLVINILLVISIIRNINQCCPPTLDMWKVLMVYVESSVTSTRRTCITPYVSAPLWGQYWSHLICNRNNSRSTFTFINITLNYLQYYTRKCLHFKSLVTRWDK